MALPDKDEFGFRYQKIMDVREKLERGLEIALGRAETAVREQQERVTTWAEQREESLRAMGRARQESDMAASRAHEGYLAHVRQRLDQARRALADLRDQRERARADLEEATRARKVIEEFRDRAFNEFLAERERAEEKIIDLHTTHRLHQAEGAQ